MLPAKPRRHAIRLRLGGLACVMACCGAAAQAAEPKASSPGFSAGLTVQPVATADDIGLPVYPGAKPYRDRDDDSSGGQINLWGGSFGMRLQALQLQTPDSVDAVARFYRDAMARYGKVLDCSNEPDSGSHADDGALHCDKERPKPGSRVFKVGTKKQARVVSIDPSKSAGATRVQLLRLEFKLD